MAVVKNLKETLKSIKLAPESSEAIAAYIVQTKKIAKEKLSLF